MSLTTPQLEELQEISVGIELNFPDNSVDQWWSAMRILNAGLGPVTTSPAAFDAVLADIELTQLQIQPYQGILASNSTGFREATLQVVPSGGGGGGLPAGIEFDVAIIDTAPNTYDVSSNLDGAISIPVGTTAQEPAAAFGLMRFDSDLSKLRVVESLLGTPTWFTALTLFGDGTADGQYAQYSTIIDGWFANDVLRNNTVSNISVSGGVSSGAYEIRQNSHADLIATISALGTNATPMSIRTDQPGKGIELRTAQSVAGSFISLQTTTDEGIDLGFGNNIIFGTLIDGIYIDTPALQVVIEMRRATTLEYSVIVALTLSDVIHRMAFAGDDWVLDDGTNESIRATPNAGIDLSFANTVEFSTKSGGVVIANELEIDGDLNHDGTNVGFYGTAPIAQQAGVAVTAGAIHAALVALGLITA